MVITDYHLITILKFEYVNYIASSIIVVMALIRKTIIAIPCVIKLIR